MAHPRRENAVRRLRHFLRKAPEVLLVGSWATGEAHLPSEWLVASQSDVDLIGIRPCAAAAKHLIISRVSTILAEEGVTPTKVAIRPLEQLAYAPHGIEWNFFLGEAKIKDRERFLLFWSMISAVEGCIRIATGKRHHTLVVSYAGCKLFYTLARNVAILENRPMRSYSELSRWAQDRLPGLSVAAAYKMKTGRLESLTTEVLAQLVGSGGLPRVLEHSLFQSVKTIGTIGDELIESLANGRVVYAESFLDIAESLAEGSNEQEIVRHERNKWRAANALGSYA